MQCRGGDVNIPPVSVHSRKFAELEKSVSDPIKLCLIQLTLETAVPFAIMDLQHIGGPSDMHLQQCHDFSSRLGSEGDLLLYGSKGKTGKIMSRFCEIIAIMAFFPGGVTCFGLHFEVKEGM